MAGGSPASGHRAGFPVSMAMAVLVALLVLGSLPGLAAAQDLGTDCELREYTLLRTSEPAAGMRVTWITQPFLVCPDGTRIRSDSAVVYEESARAELIGRVVYESLTRELRSARADYFEREGRLFARGSVVFTDPERGSVITGDTLVFVEAGPFRPEDQITVTGGRPTATIPPAARGPDAPPGEGYRVIGNRLRFEGDRFFWADGDVEVYRDDLEAFADSLAFDQDEGRLILNQNARVVGDAEMEGDQITLLMPGEVLEDVTIRGRGRLRTEEILVVGEQIHIELHDERIQRLVAVHRPTPEGADEPRPRPRATTEEFLIEGDSIHVEAPGEVIQSLYAAGRARGERLMTQAPAIPPEVLEALEPDADEAPDEGVAGPPEPGLLERDWIEGDEILALFEPADPVPALDIDDPDAPTPLDPEEPEVRDRYQLERLEARGNARTLYRSPPEDDETAPETDPETDPEAGESLQPWSISYIVANEILIYMLQGEVDRVEARGQVGGIQAEPEGRRSGPGGSSAPESEPGDGSDGRSDGDG